MTKQQVWERLQLIIRRIQIGVVLAVGILIILWTVPIARGWLISLSIFDNDSIIPIIGTAFILTFGAIVDLQRNSFKMKKMIEDIIQKEGTEFIAWESTKFIEQLSSLLYSAELSTEKKWMY